MKIKCVIWDLDETLWEGSVAENEEIIPILKNLNYVRLLDKVGIVNSICSKNEESKARKELEKLKVWDYFVFPFIDFVPKGKSVLNIIKNLQLRTENILFVDDNKGNLKEVEYYCPGINTINPLDDEFDLIIRKIINDTSGESRLKRYKILEQKSKESNNFSDNKDFLVNSGIEIRIIRNPESLSFKERIIDLANRTNQLNFTKSRFNNTEDFSEQFELDNSVSMNHGVIFVRDNYGDYGLVGFYAFDEGVRNERKFKHFYFSCRILNMGIESFMYDFLNSRYAVSLDDESVLSSSRIYSHEGIRVIDDINYLNDNYIIEDSIQDAITTVIAGCSSGMISHYLPDHMKPVTFSNFALPDFKKQKFNSKYIIYTVYSDYITKGWSKYKIFSYKKFESNLNGFIKRNHDSEIIFLLASEEFVEPKQNSIYEILKSFESRLLTGRSMKRIRKCNEIVRRLCELNQNATTKEVDTFVSEASEIIDGRHFKRVVFKRFSESFVK